MPPLRAPNGERGLVPVVLFPNDGSGYGNAYQRPDIAPAEAGDRGTVQVSTPRGYDRTINAMVLEGRRLVPSFHPSVRSTSIVADQHVTTTPAFLVPWIDADGNPITLFAVYIAAYKFANGVMAAETDATTEAYGSACFHGNGSGTAYLYAGTWSLTAGTAQKLNRRTQAGTWTQDDDVNAKYVVSLGGALWRTTSDYQISKCPPNSEPFTGGNWSSSLQVGTSAAKIVNLGGIGGTPIAFKEDGIWLYNEADTRFENRYEVPFHPNHFPFVKPDGEGGLYTATANGDIVHISQFGAITTLRLLDGKTPGRDTPRGPIVDMTIDGADLYLLMAPTYRLVQPSGLVGLTTQDNFGSFTNWLEPFDQDMSTVLVLDSFDTAANGDALLIGFDEPFLAIDFRLVKGNVNTSSMAVGLSTGAGTWDDDQPIADGTALYSDALSAERTLSQSGVVALALTADLSNWVKATYNGQSKYWWKITFSAALDAEVEVGEASIVVRRAAPQFTSATAGNAEVWEASGLLNKVLRARRDGDRLIADDVYTLAHVGTSPLARHRTPGGNKIAAIANPTPNSPDGSLMVVCRDGLTQFPLPPTRDPTNTPYPSLARNAGAALIPKLYPGEFDLGGMYRLRYVEAWGMNLVRGADYIGFAFRWDDTGPWYVADEISENYALFSFGDNQGEVLVPCIQIKDGAATEMFAPYLTDVVAWLEPLPNAVRGAREDAATPMVA